MTLPVKQSLMSLLDSSTRYLATLWKLARTDGVTQYFTDHDAALIFEGQTYLPACGFNASARQKTGGLNPQNLDMVGYIDNDELDHDDLRAGRFREAEVTEYVVDFRYPFAGAIITNTYWVTDVAFSDGVWTASLAGLSRWLQHAVGKVYTRNCRHIFGDSMCKLNTATFTTTGTVSLTNASSPRAVFESDSPGVISLGANYFANGSIHWLSGLNNGLRMEVKASTNWGEFTTQLPLPYDVTVGDVFTVYAGCDKTMNQCINKFDNMVNFGGFPFVPGTDRMIQYPDAKV
jgi:uncharacterized phage protein (TIGR02218 family)